MQEQNIRLPLTIAPIKAAQKKLDYVGIYPASLLTRLQQLVASVESDMHAFLSFYTDNQGLSAIKAEMDVTVSMICQRCQKAFSDTIQAIVRYTPVKNLEAVDELPEYYEPIKLDEFGEISLLAMLEDEMILSLPLVPLHNIEHCEVSTTDFVFGELPDEDDKPNPFSVLANLKKK